MEDKKLNIYEKLSNIQNELKVPKGQKNTFGNYKFRSCEDILEEAKPICRKHRTALTVGDKLVHDGERYYIEATATLFDLDSEATIINTAYAREEETKKGMDASQITGTASSYARKYALNGLFNIDDTKDADTDEYVKRTKQNEIEDETEEMMIQESQKQYITGQLSPKSLETILKKYNVADINALTWKQANEVYNVIDKELEKRNKAKEEAF
jgi:hypothetical protein